MSGMRRTCSLWLLGLGACSLVVDSSELVGDPAKATSESDAAGTDGATDGRIAEGDAAGDTSQTSDTGSDVSELDGGTDAVSADAGTDTADETSVTDSGADADARMNCIDDGPRAPTMVNGGWTNKAGALTIGDGQTAKGDTLDGNLTLTGFGFAIPGGATIVGITLQISRAADDPGVHDGSLVLLGGSPSPSDSRASAADYPIGAQQLVTYGGPTDPWGAAFTPAQVNNEAFGMRLGLTGSAAPFALVDGALITVRHCQ